MATYQEYLQGKPIENLNATITDSYLQLDFPSTNLCTMRKEELKRKEYFLELVKNLRKEKRKYSNVKLKGITKLLPKIEALYSAYASDVETANKLFDGACILAKQIAERGVFYGCQDDELLQKLHKEYDFPHQTLYYRTSAYSKMCELENHVLEVLRNMEYDATNSVKCEYWL